MDRIPWPVRGDRYRRLMENVASVTKEEIDVTLRESMMYPRWTGYGLCDIGEGLHYGRVCSAFVVDRLRFM